MTTDIQDLMDTIVALREEIGAHVEISFSTCAAQDTLDGQWVAEWHCRVFARARAGATKRDRWSPSTTWTSGHGHTPAEAIADMRESLRLAQPRIQAGLLKIC